MRFYLNRYNLESLPRQGDPLVSLRSTYSDSSWKREWKISAQRRSLPFFSCLSFRLNEQGLDPGVLSSSSSLQYCSEEFSTLNFFRLSLLFLLSSFDFIRVVLSLDGLIYGTWTVNSFSTPTPPSSLILIMCKKERSCFASFKRYGFRSISYPSPTTPLFLFANAR